MRLTYQYYGLRELVKVGKKKCTETNISIINVFQNNSLQRKLLS